MQITVLDAKTLGNDLDITILGKLGSLKVYESTSPEETLQRIQNTDIVITNKVVLDAKIIRSSSTLKLICIAATGMNNVDLSAAEKHGIEVKNVTAYSTKSVAQHTFAMALHLLEHIAYYSAVTKDGTWNNSKLFTDTSRPFHEIEGKTWGIIGLGSIGKEVANLAKAFGAKVIYHSTSGKNLHQAYPHHDLISLLKMSDIVSIHAPLNEKTYHLINQNTLPYIKTNGLLLNLGRGGIINETDLALALDKQKIYAGLDVLEIEPITLNNPLNFIKHKERLLITPHIAWSSIEARKKLLDGIVNNIKIFLEN